MALITLVLSFSAALPMCAEDVERVTLEPMPEEPVELQAFEVIGPTHPRYLEHTLGGFGLKPLAEEPLAAGEERFRLLWLRSFHRPALFELRFAADGSGVYEAKLWEDAAEGGRWVLQRTIALGANDRALHRRSLERLGFFALPFDDRRQGLDGATWLLEARDAERSHAVHRWSPEPGALRELGASLIMSAIKSDFLPLY